MHTCISSHGLKRSWNSCPRRVNAGNKNTPSMHHPRRRNVTTLMVGVKKRSHTQKSHQKVVNPRDIAGERKKKETSMIQFSMTMLYLRFTTSVAHIKIYTLNSQLYLSARNFDVRKAKPMLCNDCMEETSMVQFLMTMLYLRFTTSVVHIKIHTLNSQFYLSARNFDVRKAELMLRNDFAWRKQVEHNSQRLRYTWGLEHQLHTSNFISLKNSFYPSARNFDLKKTELMLRNDFAWRKQYGADTILDDYVIPEVMQKYYPGGICGQDKEGSLIWIDPCGMVDMKGGLEVREQW